MVAIMCRFSRILPAELAKKDRHKRRQQKWKLMGLFAKAPGDSPKWQLMAFRDENRYCVPKLFPFFLLRPLFIPRCFLVSSKSPGVTGLKMVAVYFKAILLPKRQMVTRDGLKMTSKFTRGEGASC